MLFKNLEAEMVRSGLSYEEIANTLKISTRTLRRKMNGEAKFTIVEAKTILSLFPNPEFTIDFLFKN